MAPYKNMFGSTRVQINDQTEKDQDGNIIKQSLLINVYAEEPRQAEEVYRDLKSRLNGIPMVLGNGGQKKSEKAPICPDCGIAMVKRTGSKGVFWGCRNYVLMGCRNTKPLESKELELDTIEV